MHYIVPYHVAMLPVWKLSLLLLCLLRGLGGGAGGILLGGALDDAHGDGLPHVTHGETSQGREVDERLHTHRLGGDEGDDGGVTGLDELGVVLKLLA